MHGKALDKKSPGHTIQLLMNSCLFPAERSSLAESFVDGLERWPIFLKI